MIEAIIIDSREPTWVKNAFAEIPHSVEMLETGDLQAVTSDGQILLVERKTPEDLLNSLRDDRLLPQIARMVETRASEQLAGRMTTWPYLVITGDLRNVNGKIATDDRGVTGWDWDAVWGALLTIQEMGCFVVFCSGDTDFDQAILRLGRRPRGDLKLLPPRIPQILGPGAAFLAGLPGIGIERVTELMKWAANTPAHALVGLTDLEIDAPVGKAVRQKIRAMLGLRDKQILDLWINNLGDETLKVMEKTV